MTAHFAASDDAERAGRYAARAAVADVGLDINILKLILNDGAGWASLMTRGRQAVLAIVAHHEPAVERRLGMHRVQGTEGGRRVEETKIAGRLVGELFDELHMAP